MLLTNGSQAGAEKPADRKLPAHLGDQITRITKGNREGKYINVHGTQEHACPAQVRASSLWGKLAVQVDSIGLTHSSP